MKYRAGCHFPSGSVVTNIPRTHPAISTDSDATATAGRKSLSDLHYAKRRGGRLRALHAAQLLAMAAGSSGCEDAHVDPSG